MKNLVTRIAESIDEQTNINYFINNGFLQNVTNSLNNGTFFCNRPKDYSDDLEFLDVDFVSLLHFPKIVYNIDDTEYLKKERESGTKILELTVEIKADSNSEWGRMITEKERIIVPAHVVELHGDLVLFDAWKKQWNVYYVARKLSQFDRSIKDIAENKEIFLKSIQ